MSMRLSRTFERRVLKGLGLAVGWLLLTAGVFFAAYRGWLASGPDSALGPTELASGIVNRPIHTRIPGRERLVANHIGFGAGPGE
jgi:hypothetical protein